MSEGDGKKRERKRRPRELSQREVDFAQHYAAYGNATAAYRAAGYPERSAASTWTLAARVLRNVQVRELIRTLRKESLDAARISSERIAQALGRIAFSDIRDLYDAKGRIKPPHEWPDELAAAVDAAESEELFERVTSTDPDTKKRTSRKELVGHSRKVKLSRRIEALRILAQWRRMVGQDVPPLELLLGALPTGMREAVRETLRREIIKGEELLGVPQPADDPLRPRVGGEADPSAV